MTKGIVRRIDELGRVVIPKELRRTMQIREGEQLEIIPNAEGELIIRKYSQFKGLKDRVDACASAISKALNVEVVIFDKNQVISHAGATKAYENSAISNALLSALEQRQAINMIKLVAVTKGDLRDYTHQYLSPIIIDSELYGGILILGEVYDNAKEIVKTINLCLTALIG